MARDDITDVTGACNVPGAFTYASVCSGIEAASAAWEPLGWKCLWLAEIDAAASAVLAFHYPDVPNAGDLITMAGRVRSGELPAPDVLIGGTPCQSFSIAGLRAGMADARGQLTMAFIALVDAIDTVRAKQGRPPCVAVWENVPGVLSHKENPFGCFLAGLAGETVPLEPPGGRWTHAGYVSGPERSVAWRTLDAQYFGLAQRRRRVFVVASADSRIDPGAILFEREGVRRDSPPSRETGESAAHPVAPSLTSSGRGVARAGETRGQDPVVASAFTTNADPHCFDARQADVLQYGAISGPVDTGFPGPTICFSSKDHGADAMDDISPTLRASGHTDSHANAGAPPAVIYADPLSPTLRSASESPSAHGKVNGTVRAALVAVCVTEPVTHCLRADGFDASEDGTGRGQPIIPFDTTQMTSSTNRSVPKAGDPCHPLAAQAHPPAIVGPLSANGGTGRKHGYGMGQQDWESGYAVPAGLSVRRLMPIECERLQGFPDHHTLARVTKGRVKLQADGPRYKQLGNSMAVPVISWIGRRIAAELAATHGELAL